MSRARWPPAESRKVAFGKRFYLSLAELQADLDAWLETYNRARSHHGYRTQARTPLQAFRDGLAAQRDEVAPRA